MGSALLAWGFLLPDVCILLLTQLDILVIWCLYPLLTQSVIDGVDMSFEIENGDTIEKLIPGDNKLAVTSDNVILYLNLFANHRLEQEVK
jgi:hypothetical protein